MDAPDENPTLKVKHSKNINLFNLDKNIAHLVSGYLVDKDLVNLCKASKGIYSLFHPSLEKRLMSYFLKYVVEGRLDKIEETLSRNPKLVFLQGDIIDLSDRIFTRITAFQYATWALDKEMWELILRYLPGADAYDQLMAFEQERPDITQVHGTRLNFSPLVEAYQKYIDNFDKWNREQREACWCKEVGGTQRQMPAWFVYVLCERGENTAWSTENFKKSFARNPKYISWWFDQEYKGGKLGSRWVPGSARGGRCRPKAPRAVGRRALFFLQEGRAAMSQFMSGRREELSRLVERLSQTCGEEKKFGHKIK